MRHSFQFSCPCLLELEKREEQARLERERRRQTSATSAVADQIRRDWQRQTEQLETEARLKRRRQHDEQLYRPDNLDAKIGRPSGYLVRVSFNGYTIVPV